MAHLQQQILDRIKTTLEAAGLRVFVDREDPLQEHELPAVLVEESPDGEQIEAFTISGVDRRALSVDIRYVMGGGPNVAAQVREGGLQIEKLIHTSAPLVALCPLGIQLNASRLLVGGDADRAMRTREQAWSFAYAARSETPDTTF